MDKLRAEEEVSQGPGELRAGPLYPPTSSPAASLASVFSIASCLGPEKGIEALTMTMAGALIKIPPTYFVPWAGCLTSHSCFVHWGIISLCLGGIPVDCARPLTKAQ